MISKLDAFDKETGSLNAVVETPQGSRCKYKFDPKNELFKLDKILPAGAVFPFNFGFIPSTLAGDGDPVDVLVLMDEPAFAGCLVPARIVGAIEATQTENNRTERNDRIIAVAVASQEHKDIKELDQLSPNLLTQIEHFFVSYHELENKPFKPIGRTNSDIARQLVENGIKQKNQA